MIVNIGDKLSDLNFQATNGVNKTLKDFQGQWVILYFYPKDSTPGCTIEGCNFRDHYAEFTKANAQVFGISRDSLKSHERFKQKQDFPFELISDEDETLCTYFSVMKEKSMFGLKVRGVERSTFLIDPEGILRQVWRGVKVRGHVAAVLAELKGLQAGA